MKEAIATDKRFIDESKLYQNHKDLNEWWVKQQEKGIPNNKLGIKFKRCR